MPDLEIQFWIFSIRLFFIPHICTRKTLISHIHVHSFETQICFDVSSYLVASFNQPMSQIQWVTHWKSNQKRINSTKSTKSRLYFHILQDGVTSWDCDLGWLVKNLDTGEERHQECQWEDGSRRMIVWLSLFLLVLLEVQIISNMLITVHVLRTSWSTMEYPHDVWWVFVSPRKVRDFTLKAIMGATSSTWKLEKNQSGGRGASNFSPRSNYHLQ